MSEATTPQADAVSDSPAASHSVGDELNRLRAGVLGANDGIVSTAAVVVGVAGASPTWQAVAVAGLASLVGGAVSMGLGEYVSVSAQRDSERARGVPDQHQVKAWTAALASFVAFFLGALLPLVAALIAPPAWRVASIMVVTLLTLAITGTIAARLGGADVKRSVARIVIGGALALAVTFLVGWLFGTTVL